MSNVAFLVHYKPTQVICSYLCTGFVAWLTLQHEQNKSQGELPSNPVIVKCKAALLVAMVLFERVRRLLLQDSD